MRASTFGVEEEYFLVDAKTLRPVNRGQDAVSALARLAPEGAVVVREFYPSQVEYSTRVFTDGGTALEELRTFRGHLQRWASAAGIVFASVGTPREPGPPAQWEGRYARIARDIGSLADDHQISGLHVHVGIADRAEGVRASNGVRRWLPLLLALSANSPLWDGRDTGYASWRAIHSRRWTTFGVPPVFADEAHYATSVSALTGIGATSDGGTINWNLRLPESHPTIEIRVFDAQLDATSTVALALISRALVDAILVDDGASVLLPDVWDAALWHSARFGVHGSIVHPITAVPESPSVVIQALLTTIEPHLEAAERRIIGRFLERIERVGTGADRQRAAHHHGIRSLRSVYLGGDVDDSTHDGLNLVDVSSDRSDPLGSFAHESGRRHIVISG